MTVSATSPINQTQAPADSTSAGRTRLAENFDMFLTLLTAQLRNQDPTAPMDSNQFMAQLVQMTSVEQQLAGNELLKQLVSNTSTNLAGVVDLIGKEVRADTNVATLSGGEAKWGYKLPSNAADVKIEVLDARGVTVRTVSATEAQRKAGEHAFVWDGKDSTGANAPDGVYHLKVTAKDTAGKAISSSVFVQGIVTSVQQEDGVGLLTLNGGKVPMALVSKVSTAPAPPPQTGEDPPPPTGTETTTDTSGTSGADGAEDPDPNNPADQTSA